MPFAMRRKASDVLPALTLSVILWAIAKRILSFLTPASVKQDSHLRCPLFTISKEMRARYDEKELALLHANPHAYIAPKATDSRAPCPALNTMANHGYM
jgi:hypothetical protein